MSTGECKASAGQCRRQAFVKPSGVALGYIGQPQLTDERFGECGLCGLCGLASRSYRTGDLVRFVPCLGPLTDSSGAAELVLEFLGRTDFQVKLRGHRVELGEIEQAACQARLATPVSAAVVLAVSRGSERSLAAFVVPESVDTAALHQALTQYLPSYMVPDTIVTRSHMPLTANGKIDRDALARSLDIIVPGRPGTNHRQPATEVEQYVLDCFKEVLGMPSSTHLGVDADFFEPLPCIQQPQLHIHLA